MRNRITIALITTMVLGVCGARMAQADTLYSQDWSGATVGQSITAAPLNWTMLGGTALIGENDHGWTGKFLDGSLSAGTANYGLIAYTLPTSGKLTATYVVYNQGAGTKSVFFNSGSGFRTMASWWSTPTGWQFMPKADVAWQVGPSFDVPLNVDVTLKIEVDIDGSKARGILSYGSTTETTDWLDTLEVDRISSAGFYADARNDGLSMDIKSIGISSASSVNVLVGTVDLGVGTENYWKTPIALEFMQDGEVVSKKVAYLDEATSSFRSEAVTPGIYEVAVSAAGHLKKVFPGITFNGDAPDLGSFTLINGDINGDNFIEGNDASILGNNWDMYGDF